MPFPLITQEQLESHIGEAALRRIYDDKQLGVADGGALQNLLNNASSKVIGSLVGGYPGLRDMALEDVPGEVTRVALDCAEALAVKRYPEVSKNKNWIDLMKQVDTDLSMLRKNKTWLDKPPERVVELDVDSEELRGW